MNLRWSIGAPIHDAFELSSAVRHNNAQVEGDCPLRVITDARQWSYSLAFRLREKIAPGPGGGPLLIRIGMAVESGCVGAVFLGSDLQSVLSTMAHQAAGDAREFLEIMVDPMPASGWLMLRNDAAGGHPSRCSIKSIQAFYAEPQPVAPAAGLEQVVSPESGKIDLGKLSAAAARARADDPRGGDFFAVLRQKWSEVPAGLSDRRRTTELMALPDEELRAFWLRVHQEATTGPGFPVRGWYQTLYQDVLRGKRVLDVGSGMGIDGLTFARQGACVTFLDLVQSNLDLLRRLCGIFSVPHADFHYLGNLDSLQDLPNDFDVIWCQGSMINAPFSFSRGETEALLRHLPMGGRWIELAYPRERWEREGRLPFNQWGVVTDGAGTPWMEWYDLDRLRARLRPAEFDVVLQCNFHGDDFNWFDLIRRQ